MNRVDIKPLTVNLAFRGRRFKTIEYKNYETQCFYLLPRLEIPEGKLEVKYRFGTSNSNSDVDNFIKQFQDILSKVYEFNDNRIYKITAEKENVKKGKEFVEFEIKKYEGIH